MRKFISGALFLTSIYGHGIMAQESTPEVATPSTDERLILVQPELQTQEKKVCQSFVESGSDVVVGRPEEGVKAAYRSWEANCEDWKNDLKKLNRGSLMIRSCGEPQKRVDKVELSTLYTYESKATYKIRVDCQ